MYNDKISGSLRAVAVNLKRCMERYGEESL